MVTLDDDEFQAIAQVIQDCAEGHREDVIGAFILTGGIGCLGEERCVALAKKIDGVLAKSAQEVA